MYFVSLLHASSYLSLHVNFMSMLIYVLSMLISPLLFEVVKLSISDSSMSSSQISATACFDSNTGNMCYSAYNSAQQKTNPWIQVDFGSSTQVSALKIFNRKNCYQDRLGRHQIFVGTCTATPHAPVCGVTQTTSDRSIPSVLPH